MSCEELGKRFARLDVDIAKTILWLWTEDTVLHNVQPCCYGCYKMTEMCRDVSGMITYGRGAKGKVAK